MASALAPLLSSRTWNYAPLTLLFLSALLILLTRLGWIGAKPSDIDRLNYIESAVKIQFKSGNNMPTAIEIKNVAGWYAVHNTFTVKSIDKETLAESEQVFRGWNLFIAFDKPTPFGQLTIDGNGASLPYHEVKMATTRFAVVIFNGDLVNLVLDVRTVR